MQKTTSIHLNGKAYTLEEAAYSSLRGYLDRAETKLATDPDKTEILADLEQAIGEKCASLLSASKDVVTESEMRSILEQMGPVDRPDSTSTEQTSTPKDAPHAPKRLYLVLEGAWIAGVCTGLAAYFDIDVTIVRIAFVALTILSSGAGILIYLALMFLVPYANTSEERAEAHGEPFNAQEVVDRAKEYYTRVAGDKGWLTMKHEAHRLKNEARARARQGRQQFERRGASPILGVLSVILACAWIGALISLITTHAIYGWIIPATIPLWVAIIALFLIYHAVTGPMHAVKWQSHNDQQRAMHDGWTALADSLGAVFIIIGLAFVYSHYPPVRDLVHNLPDQIRTWIQEIKQK